MESREEILRELRDIAPRLATLNKVNRYVLPANYFAHFTGRILLQVQTSKATPVNELETVAPLLTQLKKTDPALPTGYFNSFSNKLIDKIRESEVQAELATVAPALSQLQKVNVHQAPAGYFSALPQRLANLAGQPRPAAPVPATPPWVTALNKLLDKVIALVFRPGYNVAFAGLATSIVLAVMLYTKAPATTQTLDAKFAALTTAELDAYFSTHSDEFDQSVLDASTDDKTLLNNETKNTLSPFIKEELTDEDLDNIIL